ncbi:hypothetical protein PVK06_041415 [Gossypium arboreum]|uniref:C-JID domain-containing protein n=1 Tax=Gossypium arboreum TaxID=29729 RepID=A0ABR0N847_GOSAR|nr:hypothetical protein PVK06_041415 [Gossypium arboreum]
MALMLPLLLGLSSLTRLNLKYCNLCEGDNPSDISRLSSLETLDLGGNNFISIPSSLIHLSKLEFLGLSGCRALKSLPELPTSIKSVRISDSLEIVANPSKVYNSKYSANIVGVNCFRLAENINALTLLMKKHLKVSGNSRKNFDVIIPGSKIPEWFSQQRGDSPIKIDLPLEVWNDSQWMGVAFCCIFFRVDLICRAVIHDRHSRRANHTQSNLQAKTIDCLDQECDQLELSFPSYDQDPKYKKISNFCDPGSVKVKKCGVGLMYERDLEEMEQVQKLHSS